MIYTKNELNRSLDELCTVQLGLNATPLDKALPIVIGVDEVGRGCLFGHMTVAAAILAPELTGRLDALDLSTAPIALLNDSKKLTEKRREKLFSPIASCTHHAIVDVPRIVIDEINIAKATMLGMRVAIEQLMIACGLTAPDVHILIDGDRAPLLSNGIAASASIETLIKGDATHSSIACASILAKVHRDRQMLALSELYPEYAIASHKGYLTAAHKAAIEAHGILPEHRRSYRPISQMYHDGWLNRRYWDK